MKRLESALQTSVITISAVLANLINRQPIFASREEELVIEAIRRSSNDLKDASLKEIGNRIRELMENPNAIRGFGNNVKGIYHELLYVEAENNDWDDITAEVFPSTSHPGADVRLKEDGEVIAEIQLKATDNPHIVERHFERYPDIPVAATEEVASEMPNVENSEFSVAELEKDVGLKLEDIADDNPIGHAEDVVVTSSLMSAALQARDVLKGKKSVDAASTQALQDMGVAVTTSFLADLIFSA